MNLDYLNEDQPPQLPQLPLGVVALGDNAPCEADCLSMKVALGRKAWSHTSGRVPLLVVQWANTYLWAGYEDYRVTMIDLETGEEWVVCARACRDEDEAIHEAIIASWVKRGQDGHVLTIEKIAGSRRAPGAATKNTDKGGSSRG